MKVFLPLAARAVSHVDDEISSSSAGDNAGDNTPPLHETIEPPEDNQLCVVPNQQNGTAFKEAERIVQALLLPEPHRRIMLEFLCDHYFKLLDGTPYSIAVAVAPYPQKHIRNWAKPERREIIGKEYIDPMDNFPETVMQFYRGQHHLFSLDLAKEISTLEAAIAGHSKGGTRAQKKALEDKQWALENWKDTVHKEMALEYGIPVLASKEVDNSWNLVLLFGYHLVEVDGVAAWAARRKITKAGLNRISQSSDGSLMAVLKYELSFAGQEIVPKQCRLLPGGIWEIKDLHGTTARLEGCLEEGTVPPEFIEDCQKALEAKDQRWFKVPPGRRIKQAALPGGMDHPEEQENLLPCIYSTKDGQKRHWCLFGAFASALHLMGEQRLANLAWQLSETVKVEHRMDLSFRKLFNSGAARLSSAFVLARTKKKTRIDPLNCSDGEPDLPVLVQLRGELNHCVCFYRGSIIDSNFDQSLPITKENLDLVSGRKGYGYSGIIWSLRLARP